MPPSPSPSSSAIQIEPWRAQTGPQLTAIQLDDVDELLFGGAVFGGKSDLLLGDFAQDVPRPYGKFWHGILFRKSYKQLEDLISRSKVIYPRWFPGCRWTGSSKEIEKAWVWPNGATLRMRHMDSEDDWQEYWGHAYTWIGWDELALWASPTAYKMMKARLRSAQASIPNKRIRASANPGGPGHHWVKSYFKIDEYPMGGEIFEANDGSGMRRCFIRSRLSDNRIGMANDPGYAQRLEGTGSPELVRALKEGDWTIVAGSYFPEFNPDKHVVEPFEIPAYWARIRGMDWGSAKPFCVLWAAVSDGEMINCSSTRTKVTRETLQLRRASERWSAYVPELPQRLYACLEDYAPFEPRAEETGELQKLRARLSQTRATGEDAVRSLWGEELTNAPSRLQPAVRHYLALQTVPSEAPRGFVIPRGTLVIYREWYGWNGEPNVGCKMTAERVGAGIKQLEKWEKMADQVLDPSAFASDGGPSIAERLGLGFRRADNSRVAQGGRMGGWDQVRSRLTADESPGVVIFSTCTHLIRTLPALQHDSHRPEDVDTDAEDHACFAAGTMLEEGPIEKVGTLTRRDTRVVRVKFDDGRSVVCTPDHQFLCESGQWTKAQNLKNRRVLSAPRFRSSWGFGITAAAFIFSAKAFDCIAWCTSIVMALCQKASTFITWMKTALTIASPISLQWMVASTIHCTEIQTPSFQMLRVLPQRNGMVARQVGRGIGSTGTSAWQRGSLRVLRWCASNAGSLMRRAASWQVVRSSVISTAKWPRCVAVEGWPNEAVYCLGTSEALLCVQGGLVASNCDTLRYICMARPFVRTRPKNEPPKFETQLTVTELIKRRTRQRLADG